MIRTLVLELHVDGEAVTTGEWCPLCALPSAVRVPVILARQDSLRVVGTMVGVWCVECGERVEP